VLSTKIRCRFCLQFLLCYLKGIPITWSLSIPFRLDISFKPPLMYKSALKYLPDLLSGISSLIPLFLPYIKSRSISNIPENHTLLYNIAYIMDTGSTDTCDSNIFHATHKDHCKHGYYTSNQINHILLLWCKIHQFHTKLKVSILLHIFNQIPSCKSLIFIDSFFSEIHWSLTHYNLFSYLISIEK